MPNDRRRDPFSAMTPGRDGELSIAGLRPSRGDEPPPCPACTAREEAGTIRHGEGCPRREPA